MRNLKRALSLTLASVMLLGMMVVGSSAAAGYSDVDENDNVEAIEVLQAVEVMVGDDRGFGPDRPVTRNEMAVVMGKLLNLNYNYYASSCPFTDVAEWARGWVGACYANGIVSGRGDGIYDGEATVTAVEAASMMMRALGYFKYTEDYADGFQLVTVRQGSEIGIFSGVGTDAATPMTRNQVAQMALNALQANMVNFTGTPGIEVNGVKVGYKAEYTFRSGTDGKYSAISNQGNTTDGTTNQSYIQLGEELYDGDLRLNAGTTDSFGRPARYWEYDGTAIGTYAKKELLRKAYTEKVTGKDLYDLLGKDIVNLINGGDYRTSYTLDVTIDGNVNSDPKNFAKSALTRTNTDGVGGTGNGVLTEVYVDNTARTVDIAIINTYLAIAENDYNEKKDEVSLKVYNLDKSASPAKYFKDTDGTKNAETTLKTNAEDLNVADVKKDDKFLVTVANGELKSLVAPEILTEQTISSHKVDKYVVSDKQYDYATTAQYDVDVMENFGSVDMKEVTYNIVLDKYGYLIGVEQNEEVDQYVFLTGIDDAYSHLSQKNVPVNIIHLDGTMETVTMNTKKSTKFTFSPIDEAAQANTWCTYSVDNDGIYTLTQVASVTNKANKVKVAQSAQDAAGGDIKINSKNISLDGDGTVIGKVHGNDSTVYINVDMINVDVAANAHRRIVDDVDSVVTGVTNVDLTVKNRTKAVEGKNSNGVATFEVAPNEVYTLYKDNGTIIAVVTLEALDNATTKHYAYINSSNIDHRDYDATTKEYSWYREAIVDGEFVMLKEVDDSSSSTYVHNGTGGLARGKWYEIKYNADGEVRDTTEITYAPAQGTAPSGNMPQVGTKWMQDANMVANAIDKTFILQADYTTAPYNTELKYVGGTLYTGNDTTKGVYVAPTAKVVVFTKNYDKHEEFTGAEMEKALAALNDKEHFNGYVNAVIGSNGVATVVIIDEKTAGSSGNNTYTVSVDGDTTNMSYTMTSTDGGSATNTALTVKKGSNVVVTFTAGDGYVFTENKGSTIKRTITNVSANTTVTAPAVEEGVEEITLKVKLGTGVAYITVGTDQYADGGVIKVNKGTMLTIALYDTNGSKITTSPDPVLQFQAGDSETDRQTYTKNSSSNFLVNAYRSGTLFATTDARAMNFQEAKTRLESNTLELWYTVDGGNGYMQYYSDAGERVDRKLGDPVFASYGKTVGNSDRQFNDAKEAEVVTAWMQDLIARETNFKLDTTDTNGIAINVANSWEANVVPTVDTNDGSFVYTRDITVYKVNTHTIATGTSDVIGTITVTYKVHPKAGDVTLAAPGLGNIASSSGDVSDKKIVITGTSAWAGGKYTLYKADGTKLAEFTNPYTGGTTLTFTGIEGLTTTATTFRMTYSHGDTESPMSQDIVITPVS